MHKFNIHCIELWLPQTMNLFIMSWTNCKHLFMCGLCACDESVLLSLSFNSFSLNRSDNFNTCCIIMKQATLITADKMSEYCSDPFQLSFLTFKTVNAHINTLLYSLWLMNWFNNLMQKSKHIFWIFNNSLSFFSFLMITSSSSVLLLWSNRNWLVCSRKYARKGYTWTWAHTALYACSELNEMIDP